MGNRASKWLYVILITVGMTIAISLGIYAYRKGGVANTNVLKNPKLALDDSLIYNDNTELLNDIIETSVTELKISPNAIITEKRYYKECDHLIREALDVPEELVNQDKKKLEEFYRGWNIEKCSATEITVYKEFKGMCNEHYVVKDHNGVLGIFIEDEDKEQVWQEDTEIDVQYLPQEDIEKFKEGIKVIGKTNLDNFLEDYE